MTLPFALPNNFVPEEKEFQAYCALKLLKNKYITKEEAMAVCGFQPASESNEKKFNALRAVFEKRYKKLCGEGYADSDFVP